MKSTLQMLLIIAFTLTACREGARSAAKTDPPVQTKSALAPSVPVAPAWSFEAELQRQRIDYPIESIRTKFDTFVRRIESGQIRLVQEFGENRQTGAALAIKAKNGNLELHYYAPAFEELRNLYRYNPGNFVDEFIAILLHEEYHLIAQGGNRIGERNPAELVEFEREAWWYTVKELLLPMVRVGRLRNLDPNDGTAIALEAYKRADGSIMSSAWTTFSRWSTGIPDQVLDHYHAAKP